MTSPDFLVETRQLEGLAWKSRDVPIGFTNDPAIIRATMNVEAQTTFANDFPETADIHSSSDEYATRFSGETGEWFLEIQAQQLKSVIPGQGIKTALDIGGGHAQTVKPLLDLGISTTVIGSSPECAKRLAPLLHNHQCSFQVGNLVELPFANHSFDLVNCFRFLSHCSRWEKLIEEMCRVAKRGVVIDYPRLLSFNILYPLLFKLKRHIEKNTRTFLVFRDGELRRAFASHGFHLVAHRHEFFFPMGMHRGLGNHDISVAFESGAKKLGLTAAFGSPVIAYFERVDAAH